MLAVDGVRREWGCEKGDGKSQRTGREERRGRRRGPIPSLRWCLDGFCGYLDAGRGARASTSLVSTFASVTATRSRNTLRGGSTAVPFQYLSVTCKSPSLPRLRASLAGGCFWALPRPQGTTRIPQGYSRLRSLCAMAPASLRQALTDQYGRPLASHYLRHRRRYSNLLMVAFSVYVLQNVSARVWRCPAVPLRVHRADPCPSLGQTIAGLTGNSRPKKKPAAGASKSPSELEKSSVAVEEDRGTGKKSKSRRRGPRVEVSLPSFHRRVRING